VDYGDEGEEYEYEEEYEDEDQDDAEDQEKDEVEKKPFAIVKGVLYDADGNKMSGILIHIRDNGAARTDENGEFIFDHLTNLGNKDVYVVLSDKSEYVFRKVNLVAGKGTKITLVYDDGSSAISTGALIAIISGGGAVLAAAIVLALLMLKKKKLLFFK